MKNIKEFGKSPLSFILIAIAVFAVVAFSNFGVQIKQQLDSLATSNTQRLVNPNISTADEKIEPATGPSDLETALDVPVGIQAVTATCSEQGGHCNSCPPDGWPADTVGPDPYCGCVNTVGQDYHNSGCVIPPAPTGTTSGCGVTYSGPYSFTVHGPCYIGSFSGPSKSTCPVGPPTQYVTGGTYTVSAPGCGSNQIDWSDTSGGSQGGGVCAHGPVDCGTSTTPTPTPIRTPTSTPRPPTATPTPVPVACQSTTISGSLLSVGGTLNITSVANVARVTKFTYTFYNLDNRTSAGIPKPIQFVANQNYVVTETTASPTNSHVITINYSQFNRPDLSNLAIKPVHIQMNAQFTDPSTGLLSPNDASCVEFFNVAPPPTPTPTPTLTPIPTPAVVPLACKSTTISKSQLSSGGSLSITSTANVGTVTQFHYTFFNLDHRDANGIPQVIQFTAGQPFKITEAVTSPTNSHTITVTYSQLDHPDLNYGGAKPIHIQVNTQFTDISTHETTNYDAACVVFFNIIPPPTPTPTRPVNTPTPTPPKCVANADIAVVIDRSSTMYTEDFTSPTTGITHKKLQWATDATLTLVSGLYDYSKANPSYTIKMGLVTFGARGDSTAPTYNGQPPYNNSTINLALTNTLNKAGLSPVVANIWYPPPQPNLKPGTCIECGIKLGDSVLSKGTATRKAVILLSDGRANKVWNSDGHTNPPNSNPNAAAIAAATAAKNKGMKFFVLGYNDNAGRINETTLKAIASGGTYIKNPDPSTWAKSFYAFLNQICTSSAAAW